MFDKDVAAACCSQTNGFARRLRKAITMIKLFEEHKETAVFYKNNITTELLWLKRTGVFKNPITKEDLTNALCWLNERETA